ncbi:MAG: hypothetical protein SYC29_16415 [Planctomycetota bacterium]|nr:hypothetical protein [Planctomycetota bacterium]
MKRWLFTILLFLLLGAIVNMAVAWGLAFRPEPGRDGHWLAGNRVVRRITVDDDLLDTYICAHSGEIRLDQHWHLPGTDLTPWVEDAEYRNMLPFWMRGRDEEPLLAVATNLPKETGYTEFAAGWPIHAFRWWRLTQWNRRPDTLVDAGGLLVLPERFEWQTGTGPTRRELPYLPIWPGFAVNTLFYALILWLLIGGPFVLRRLIRIRRGRCPKCGYDLRHALSGTARSAGGIGPRKPGRQRRLTRCRAAASGRVIARGNHHDCLRRSAFGSRTFDQVQSVPPPLQEGGEGVGALWVPRHLTSCDSPPPSPSPSEGEGNAYPHFTRDPCESLAPPATTGLTLIHIFRCPAGCLGGAGFPPRSWR